MKISKPQDIERSAIRKLTLHIVPLMILLYFPAFLDRNNMAYAAKALEDNTGLTASAFGFASGIFFIGYFLFEIPSNAGTIKFGPRIWFARILISGASSRPCSALCARRWSCISAVLCWACAKPDSFLRWCITSRCSSRKNTAPKFSVCSSSSSRCPTPSARRFPALFSIFSMIGSGSLPATAVYPRRAAADRHRPADPVPDQELAQGRRLSERGGKGG